MAEVNLTVAADLAALRSQLASIPGLTADAAQRMTNELNKSIKAAEKASTAAAKAASNAAKASANEAKAAMDTATAAADKFGDRAGALGSNASKLAGVLDLIAPGAGELARGLGDVADAGEVAAVASKGLGLSLGSVIAIAAPVAIAVGAMAYAFKQAAEEMERVEARNKSQASAATGAMRAAEQYQDLLVERNKLLGGENQKVAEAVAIQLKYKRALDEAVRSGELDEQQTENLRKQLERNQKTELENLEISRARAAADKTATDNATKRAQAVAKQAAADAEAAAAAQAAMEIERQREEERLAAVDAEVAAGERYRASLQSLEAAATKAAQSRLNAEGEVLASMETQIESVNALALRSIEQNAANAYEVQKIEQARADAVMAIENEHYAKLAELRAKDTEDELARQREKQLATAQAYSGLFSSVSQLTAQSADEMAKTDKEGAMRMFAISKAAALAEATVNTALAISNALTLPPPANIIAATAAGVTGAAQAAAIAAAPPPSFNDTAGVQQMGTRGLVSLASGDYFAAARDPAELQRQVGAMASAQPQILQVRLGHKVLDQSVARTIKQGGRLSREIANRSRPGVTGHTVRA